MSATPMQHWFEGNREPDGGENGASQFSWPQPGEESQAGLLSVVLIGPDPLRRAELARAIEQYGVSELREFSSYPPSLAEVPRLLEVQHDVIVIDLDSDLEYALELVESIDSNGAATTMVYSGHSDPDLLVRCMRAGAREFLTLPLVAKPLAEAFERAAARRPAVRVVRKPSGRLLVFMGAKGGAGATMLAANFAVALAQEPNQRTLLIDMDLPLGDAALSLGIVSEYSTINALQAASRLDGDHLRKLLARHSSGLFVLGAPGRFMQYQANSEGIDKLMAVARQEFENVVVDVGSRLDLAGTALFRESNAIYLVTQAGIPELRNSNRLISEYFSGAGPRLQIVLNRFEPRALGVSEEHITKALTRPAQWKIPNDYAAVRDMQINAAPLALTQTAIAHLVRRMARAAIGGQAEPAPKKRGFGLFG